jgi:hypothetical protein
MTNRINHATRVRYAVSVLALGAGLLASWNALAMGTVYIPTAYDHPFTGRMIVEQESLSDVFADARCQHSWDGGLGKRVYACSWHFDDPLNPGQQACHLVHPKIEEGVWTSDEAAEALRVELANCNGWHDSQAVSFTRFSR